MLDTAIHVRIFDPNPSDDLVTKREEAISALAETFGAMKNVDQLLDLVDALAAGIQTGGIAGLLAADIEATVKLSSPAFIHEGNELQTLVCALLAAGKAVKRQPAGENWFTTSSVIAAGLWLALSYAGPDDQPKLDRLCTLAHDLARDHIAAVAESSRQRVKIPVADVVWPDSATKPNVEAAIKEGLNDTIDALRKNAVLDREEIDILWWALGDFSSLLNERLSSAPIIPAALAAAIELGRKLRRPPANAHNHLVLRYVRQHAPITLPQLLESIESVRERFAFPASTVARVKRCPHVFPVLSAIAGAPASKYGNGAARPLSAWCTRALAESAIVHLSGTPDAGV
ncbi:GTPase-associated system all-helical protein GASH [Burkholderia cenocepacia]|uniref:GTPase-associated system all-helical protein GASH n=1 Tax=Burkholderia cenocepacia TaxID=95486 RepID=UPI000F66EF98|nr:GTPase-associated system all-helical protein GASH [Burkholderia cenocepacia]